MQKKRLHFFVKRSVTLILLVCLFTVSFFYAPSKEILAASGPAILSYQGRLSDIDGDLVGGSGTTYYFKFSIWDNATVGGGSRLWPVSAPTATTATVRQGVFTVLIGDTDNGYPDVLDYDFSQDSDVYLQVEVSSDGSSFQTLSPRQRIAATAFSELARSVSGTRSSSFGTTTPIGPSVVSILATSSSARPLTIRGATGQSASLFTIQNSAGADLFSISAGGAIFASSTLMVDGATSFGSTLSAGTTTITNLIVSNISTSTFTGGLSALALDVSGGSTSTFANGIQLSGGCFRDASGSCISGGGGGAVSSVSNSDGTLTISPTTGNVIASLNLGNANTWTGAQTFNALSLFGQASSTRLSVNDRLYVGGTSTSTLRGDGATSTFSGGIDLASGNINLATGGNFLINNVRILDASALGASVLASSLTSVGALDSGSITSGFGSINIGADAITTTGQGSFGDLLATGTSTLYRATSTISLYTSILGVGSDYLTDLTGTGLQNSGGALTLNATGDWTGTLDGQEGSYYLDAKNLTNFGSPFYTFFAATTTDALAQGSINKYWSDTLFDNRLSASSSIAGITTLANLSITGSQVSNLSTLWDNRLAASSSVSSITALPNLSLAFSQTSGTAGVSRGGTGATAFGQGWLYSDGGTNTLSASTSPTVNYLTATSTTATSTLPYLTITQLGLSSDYLTDLTGTGLQNSSGALTLNATGDWTGTLDGQEGSYYLDAKNLTNFGSPFYTFFAATTTDALAQGSINKYWSDTLFDNRLSASSSITGITTLANLTTTGALNAGSITSGFGTIDIGTDTLAAGTTTITNLVVSNISTSTFAGGLTLETSGLVYDWQTNKVGIGTVSPEDLFEVAFTGGNTEGPMITLRNLSTGIALSTDNILGEIKFAGNDRLAGDSGVGAKIVSYAETGWNGSSNANPAFLAFYTNPAGSGALAERMRITSAGLVGVGTTSPGLLFSVGGDSYFGGNITATGTASFGTTTVNNLVVSNTSTSTFAGGLSVGGSTGLSVLSHNGYVGIGTTTPISPLTIDTIESVYRFNDGDLGGIAVIPNASDGVAISTLATIGISGLTFSDNGSFILASFPKSEIIDGSYASPTYWLDTSGSTLGLGTGVDIDITNGNLTIANTGLATLPYASSTALSVSGNLYVGNTQTANIFNDTTTGSIYSILSNTGENAFVFATTTSLTGPQAALLSIGATTTGALDYARVAVGTTTAFGPGGLRDQFTVAGRIYQTWRFISCDFPGSSVTGVISSVFANYCGGAFLFNPDTDGTIGSPTDGSGTTPAYTRLKAGASTVTASDGAQIKTLHKLANTTQNSVFEVLMRTPTESTDPDTVFAMGFTNYSATPDLGAPPTNAVYFLATTTTWHAMTVSASATTTVNTMVATSSAAFQRMRIELAPNLATFIINNKVVARIDTTVPSVAMAPIVWAAITGDGGGVARDIDIASLRLWIDDPPEGYTPPTETKDLFQDTIDLVRGADIAESYLTEDPDLFMPGTIVTATSTPQVGSITRSAKSYQGDIFGIVSTSPNSIIGYSTAQSASVALLGRVPTRVSTLNGKIEAGDPITSSSILGVGMRATRPGQIVGYALEGYDPENNIGKCEIGAVDYGICEGKILVRIDAGFSFNITSTAETIIGDSFGRLEAVDDLASDIWEDGLEKVELVLGKLVAKLAVIEKLFTSTLVILPGGDITVPAGANEISGEGLLSSGQREVFITNTKVTKNSRIFFTPRVSILGQLALTGVEEGKGFNVSLVEAPSGDIPFTYLIIETYGGREIEERREVQEQNQETPAPPNSEGQSNTEDNQEENVDSEEEADQTSVVIPEEVDEEDQVLENEEEISSESVVVPSDVSAPTEPTDVLQEESLVPEE